MAELDQYRTKRNFNKTREPEGGTSRSEQLHFVVQKHAASHLHYDFRLEVKGVLKSWAVPRGPSMDPGERRLAMPVEDHPYDYKDFEGIIPEGQYGGGTVMVWDEGTYEPVEKLKTKKEQEHWMMSNYYKNALEVILHGHKLKGKFILIKFKDDKYDGGWRLIKVPDQYTCKKDILLENKSVKSGLTIEEISKMPSAAVWQSNRGDKPITKQRAAADFTALAKQQGTKAPMPGSVPPMLCTLTKEVLNSPEYLYELKWDGYRIVSSISNKNICIASRSSLDYTKKYPPIVQALKDLGHEAVLDGEVVVFNDQGKPDFDALQLYNGHETPINYCLFDILWLDGYDLQNLSLKERKDILKGLVAESVILRYSESFDDGQALYQKCLDLDLEGIVAKKRDSTYQPGARNDNWLKTPTRKRQEFVVGGWAESDKARSFRSILFGAYNNGKLEWIGRSGGGFKEKDMPDILKVLEKLEIKESPFSNKVLDTKGAKLHWLKPELVANFEFATWTKAGRIRKPATFLGFRKDKNPTDVAREVPLSVAKEKQIENSAERATPEKAEDSNWPMIMSRNITSQHDFQIEGHTVSLDNIEQDIWTGVNKAVLISYYHSVAKYLLPYLKNRPLSLHIKDHGAEAPGFYIKDMEGNEPDFASIFRTERKHKKKGKRNVIDYLVCNNEATLLYLVNLGCIDFNPWSSRIENPEKPDFISVDLDPSDEDFNKVVRTALAAKELFDEHRLQSFVKTSGKTGMHLFIPCAGFTFPQARTLAEKLCTAISNKISDISTTNINISQRGDKLFVDPSQNDFADTLASAYSVRPHHHPTVSTPLEWKEVNEKLNPGQFTMTSIIDRLKKKGDLFKDISSEKIKQANNKQLKKLI